MLEMERFCSEQFWTKLLADILADEPVSGIEVFLGNNKTQN